MSFRRRAPGILSITNVKLGVHQQNVSYFQLDVCTENFFETRLTLSVFVC